MVDRMTTVSTWASSLVATNRRGKCGAVGRRAVLISLLLATLVGGALACPASFAAGRWSAPSLVGSDPTTLAVLPDLDFSLATDGTGLIRFRAQGYALEHGGLGKGYAISDQLMVESEAVAHGRLVALGPARCGPGPADRCNAVGVASLGTSLGKVRFFGEYVGQKGALAIGRGGRVLALVYTGRALRLWSVDLGHLRGRFAVIRRGSAIRDPAIAVNDRGDLLVAWWDGKNVYARFRPRGAPFGEARRVGPAYGQPRIRLALDRRGRALAGWTSESVAEGESDGADQVVAYARSQGRFQAPQALERMRGWTTRPIHGAALQVGFSSRGQGFALWTGRSQRRFVVRAAVLAAGRFGKVQQLSDPRIDSQVDSLSFGGDDALAVWSAQPRRVPDHAAIMAAVRGAGHSKFTKPEVVSPDTGQGPYAAEPDIGYDSPLARGAIDITNARAYVVWSYGNHNCDYSTRTLAGPTSHPRKN
jgi:hypothetical protein